MPTSTHSCHPNRDTMAAITAAGLHVVQPDRFDLPAMPALARPHALGSRSGPRNPVPALPSPGHGEPG